MWWKADRVEHSMEPDTEKRERPPVLYKYRALRPAELKTFTLDILTGDKVYFAKPSEVNDPFAGQARISFTGLEESRWRGLQEKDDLDLMESLRETVQEDLRVFSLSAVRDHTVMWSHYADSHRGICLGFDASTDQEWFGLAMPVRYISELPLIEFDSGCDNGRIYYATALSKSAHWSYEEEWRVADFDPKSVRRFPGKLLVEVILGCKISEKDKLEVLAWSDLRPAPVMVWQARQAQTTYGLELDPVGKVGGWRRSGVLDLT